MQVIGMHLKVPVKLLIGKEIATFCAAIMRPFGSTANCATCVWEPHVPILLLTVGNVVTFEPALVVTSPVNAGN